MSDSPPAAHLPSQAYLRSGLLTRSGGDDGCLFAPRCKVPSTPRRRSLFVCIPPDMGAFSSGCQSADAIRARCFPVEGSTNLSDSVATSVRSGTSTAVESRWATWAQEAAPDQQCGMRDSRFR